MNSSIQIRQFRYCRDNFSYLLHIEQDALVIDGGAVDDILHLLAAHELFLKYVLNTHSHYDHTSGNNSLLAMTRADFVDCRSLAEQGKITLANRTIQVIATPGHTDDSISFYTGSALIAGDTLFNGTVGNCFSGNMKAFFDSIRRLLELPDETVVYAGHDYVRESMSFARMLEPDNPAIDQYLKKYDPEHVFSTIGEEKKMNPFVRFDEPAIIEMLQQGELPGGTSFQRWRSLMSIEE